MRRICCIVLLALILTGCKAAYEIIPDTIVDVPVNPTGPAEETAPQVTESLTEGPTRPAAPEIPTYTVTPTDPGNTEPVSYDPAGYSLNRLDRAVAAAVNGRREEAGLALLTLDPRLCAIASVRARENTVRWGHTRPDGSDWRTVLEEYGYGYAYAAENVWYGTGTAGDIVGKWMGDADARAGLLMDGAFIGVGSYTTAEGVTCVAVLIVG